MKLIAIKRISMIPTGTYGVLLFEDGTPFCLTLELPWMDNKHDISCVPKGEYIIKKVIRPTRGEVF